jgi:hypothetical protein
MKRLILFTILSCSACAAANEQLLRQFVDDSPARAGGVWCSAAAIEHEAAAQLRQYLPPELTVYRWQGAPAAPDEPPLPEKAFFTALEQGTARLVLITAQAGHGKSRFADTLEATLCRTAPILRVEGDTEFAQRVKNAAPGSDPIAETIAVRLGLADDAERTARLRELLDKARWILLVDSPHDLAPADRALVIKALKNYIDSHQRNLQTVVLARPAVVNSDSELGAFDSVLEIPELTCERTEQKLQSALRGKPRLDKFWRAAKQFGLDAQQKVENRCRYQYLATFRAIQVAVDLAVATGLDRSDAEFEAALKQPPDQVLQRYLETFLSGDARRVGSTAAKLVALAEQVVTQAGPGQANTATYTSEACQVAAAAVGGLPDKAFACERVLALPMFVQVGNGVWRLEQGVVGSFLARKAAVPKT